jgi:hypothetical protein
MDSEGLVLHVAVGYFRILDFSIPGTKVEQGHFVKVILASSMDVVVERRVDSSWKTVGMVLGMHLHLDF